jgi:hypothetical protein
MNLNIAPPPPTAIFKDETPKKLAKKYTAKNESTAY